MNSCPFVPIVFLPSVRITSFKLVNRVLIVRECFCCSQRIFYLKTLLMSISWSHSFFFQAIQRPTCNLRKGTQNLYYNFMIFSKPKGITLTLPIILKLSEVFFLPFSTRQQPFIKKTVRLPNPNLPET